MYNLNTQLQKPAWNSTSPWKESDKYLKKYSCCMMVLEKLLITFCTEFTSTALHLTAANDVLTLSQIFLSRMYPSISCQEHVCITYPDTMRPISSRQRYTCLGSLCNTKREENKEELQFIFIAGGLCNQVQPRERKMSYP